MNMIKSISKRTLALILSMLMLLSSGIVGTLAANVELVETGVQNYNWYGNVFFLAPEKWDIDTYNKVQIDITRTTSATSSNYQYYAVTMTRVGNSRLFYAWLSADHSSWGQTEYIAFTANSSEYGSGTFALNGNHYYTTPLNYGCASNNYYFFKPSNETSNSTTTNGNTMSGSYNASRSTLIRAAQTVNIYTDEASSANGGTVKMTGYTESGNTSLSSSSSTSTGTSISYTATQGSLMTLTATAKSGYSFVGWYNGTTLLGSNTTYTYNVFNTKTITAKFEKDIVTYTYTFNDMNGNKITSGTLNEGETPTAPTAPTVTGYTFTGWSPEVGPLTGNTTYTAQYTPNTYTITYYDEDRTTVLGTAKADYNTLISAATAPTATKASTAQYDYAFGGWTLSNGTAIGSTTVTGNVSVYATYKQTLRSYTVDYSGENGDVKVAYSNGTIVPSGSSVPYGTVLTLTATPDKFYNVGTWTANGSAVTGTTYTVTGDVELIHNFAAKTTYEIVVQPNRDCTVTYTCTGDIAVSEDNFDAYIVEEGAEVTFTVEAPNGFYLAKVGDETNDNYNITQKSFTVEADSDKYIIITCAALPTYEVTVSASNADAGTVSGGGTVIYGTTTTLTATANEGYRFTGWTASNENYRVQSGSMENVSVTIIPNTDVEFTANFVANKGTVNVSATEGGTVTNAGEHNVTYPETVTATATADTSNGYLFTHWTVKSEGKEGTDYAITENNNKITVQILTDGTVVDVVANFANAQKIKVYTYSDGGFNSLKITESNGTQTLTPYDGNQSPVAFGNKTWYTPGEVTLTAGYNNAITAQMYGSNPLENGTGNLVIFNNTVGWSNVYLYTSATTMWNPELNGNTQDCTTKGLTAVQMQRIGSTNYYYAYVDSTFKYTLFLETENNNYDRVHNNNASYRADYSASKPMFTPLTTASSAASDATNNTNYYNSGSWAVAPTVPTTTSAVDITSTLYNGNEWLGNEEVWLYFAANGATVVATNRRQLNDYVTSALIKGAYNNGKNDKGYTDSSWSAFTSAYTAAVSTLGTGASTQAQIDSAYTTLETAYNALALTTTVTITGSHGAMPGYGTYYGTISFPDEGITVSKHTGNIGDSDSDDQTKQNCEYLTATVDRNQIITINTTVVDSDHMVLGWVVNGTEFVSATQDIDNTDLFVGTYTCSNNAVIVPIYFRDDTIAKFNEGSDDIIKLYAKTDDRSTTWGNYMAAYTWTASTYRQFGRWTGQLMIPDVSNPGMYYTYVEKFNPEAPTEVITGITFNNYGNNTGIYTGQRYQAYDYYEFMELAEQGFDNIVFELNESDGVSNWPSQSKLDLGNNNYNFYPFTDFSGNEVDITRVELTDEQKALDPALYIVRTGPCDPDTDGIGHGSADLSGSDFYVNAYVYDADGNFLVACKTYELLNLDDLKTKRGVDLSVYAGKPVEVDYASLTDTSGNKRYDGEWFGTKYGFTTVDISVEVAYLNADGTVTYYSDSDTPNSVDGVGSAYINGEASVEVDHGSEGHVINAIVPDGNDFVGWYRATANGDGTYSIDVSAAPLFTERSATIDASADAIYIAVFKEHPEGAFTVNNYYYTYDDFKGQAISPYVPPVFGNDTAYSSRFVQIKRIYNSYHGTTVNEDLGKSSTYTQTMDSVNVGDKLEITIYTKPTYPRDYVYAWYIQANDSYGVNFEEIGTNRAFDKDLDKAKEQSFTFTYTVEEGVSNITIYSDVVHISDIVTLNYVYTNRFGVEQKYIVKHKLTQDELANDYKPSSTTIRDNAPKVDDLFKDLEWKVDETQSDATNYTLRATENNLFDITVTINGETVLEEQKKYNEPMEIKAYELAKLDRSKPGIWYLETGVDGEFTEGEDRILGYGQYYGLVVTGDANIYYTDDYELVTQIVLADAVYGAEKVTDENGNVTVDKVYVDYLISYLLNVFSGQYIDLDNDGIQDANERTITEANNISNPVSVDAIRAAGYTVDYGMVLELLNTFNAETKQNVINTYYGQNKTLTANIEAMLKADKTSWADTGYADTYFYKYEAEDYGFNVTNKNRVLMTFGYDNTEAMRNRYYNVMAYLVISDANGNNPNYWYSNQATLNIQEADDITN